MEDVDRTFLLTTDALVERFKAFLGNQALPFRVVVSRVLERRSHEQNARLWKLHGMVGKQLGYTPAEIHEESLCRYFGFKEETRADLFTGEIVKRRVPLRRSSMRNKKEFSDYMEATETWYASDFGVWLE